MRILLCAFSVLWSVAVSHAAVLESPAHGAMLSGLGFISGWKCHAGQITVQINAAPPLSVATSQPRADTRRACGTVNTGFIAQINWNLLGGGRHTAVAADDGVEFARATFTVGTTGEEFVEDVTLSLEVPDFPAPGERGQFVWNESTQHLELVRVMPTARTPPPPQVGRSHLYWTGRDRIQRARLDGTQVTTLLRSTEQYSPGFYSPLALDLAAETMYWTNSRGIYRATLDGSQVETLIVGEDIDFFALAPARKTMYWMQGEDIWRANLDGSQPAVLHPADPAFPQTRPKTLVIDPAGDTLYWQEAKRLHRISLDDATHDLLFTEPQRALGGDALAVDTENGKVYWVKYHVYRANLDDGSHVELLVPDVGYGSGLVLDLDGGKMYWTLWDGVHGTDEGLYRANLDGSQVEALVTGAELGGVTLAPGQRGE